MSTEQSQYSEALTSALEILSAGPSVTSFPHSDPWLCHRAFFDGTGWGMQSSNYTRSRGRRF